MKKKRIVMTIVLWLTLALWLGIIYYLSTQNGEQTAQTGMMWARKLAGIVYQNPTDAQLADFHMILRKFAHLVLFLMLGSMTTWVAAVTFPKGKGIWKGYYLLFSTAITVGCGYFDEWHKQFISGRHFDHIETTLNIWAGIIGIVTAVVVILICRIIKWCMES